MQKLFIDYIPRDFVELNEEQTRHVAKALRMKVGDELVAVAPNGKEYCCQIEEITKSSVRMLVCYERENATEPSCKVHIYQGVPKGDKLEDVIQKCTELGMSALTPVLTRRSVSRPDEKSAKKKNERYKKIALEAAQQSGRGIIPKIETQMTLKQALAKDDADTKIVFYEGGGENLRELVFEDTKSVSFYIGPEGGFDKEEVEMILESGARVATLGPRILRTQTAPVAAITAIMMLSGNL